MIDAEMVAKVRKTIGKSGLNYAYFFDNLSSPEWLEPLAKEGFFDAPPAARAVEGGWVFPIWPASRYLVRMADLAPEPVCEIVLAMPESDNLRVLDDVVDCARSLPPRLAGGVAKKVAAWLADGDDILWFLPENVASLAQHVAQEMPEASVALVHQLVALRPSEDPRPFGPPLRSRTQPFEFERILSEQIPTMAQPLGVSLLEALCVELDRAIALVEDDQGPAPRDDDSHWWRPAIERHSQNSERDPRSPLVGAIRGVAVALLDEHDDGEVLATIERHPWKVFRRIGLNLRSSDCSLDPTGVTQALLSESLRTDVAFHREIYWLAAECFKKLREESQQEFLANVELDAARRAKSATREDGEVAARRLMWRRLWPIRNDLTGGWRERLETLKAEFGSPEHPDLLSYSTSGVVGTTSPLSAEEMREKGRDGLRVFLIEWVPGGDELSGPSRSGLGAELATLAASTPAFLYPPFEHVGLGPTFVRSILDGWKTYADSDCLDWDAVFPLMEYAASQAERSPNQVPTAWRDGDPDWDWAKKTAIALLERGVEEGSPSPLAQTYRKRVWKLVTTLVGYRRLADWDGQESDPSIAHHVAINSVGPSALRLAVSYGLWIMRDVETQGSEWPGIGSVPELAELIETELGDPALSIPSSAMLGFLFPWLVVLDEAWAESLVEGLFPDGGRQQARYRAAWFGYIRYNRPYDVCFRLLRGVYQRSAVDLNALDPEEDSEIFRAMARHVAAFLWRGLLQSRDELTLRLCEERRGVAFSEFLSTLGRWLSEDGPPIEATVLERLQATWDWLRSCVQEGELQATPLSQFGWWFHSGRFETEWVLGELELAARLGGGVVVPRLVLKELARVSGTAPGAALRAFEAIERHGADSLALYTGSEAIQAMLREALADPTAAEGARRIANRLLAKGYHEYRSLISDAAQGDS